MSSEWTRTEKLTLYSLLVAVIGVSVTLFTVQEFRRFLGLSSSATTTPHTTSASSVAAESPEASSRQPETRMINVPAQRSGRIPIYKLKVVM